MSARSGSGWRGRVAGLLAVGWGLVLALAACSGGSGGAAPDDGGSTALPTAGIVFPTPTSYTDATTIHVRGVAASAQGVKAVSVNGVAATSTDGFATWVAEVPLATGQNPLAVTVTDTAGRVRVAAATAQVTQRGPAIANVRSMDTDAANGRVLVTDQLTATVYAVRISDGVTSILSDPAHGSGPAFSEIEDLVVDAPRQRALVVDWGLDRLLAVDLATGNRSIVSPAPVPPPGAGPASFSLGFGVALDDAGARAFVTSRDRGTVVAIDLATGVRSVLSGPAAGSGPALSNPMGLAYDAITNPAQPRLLVASGDAIVAIDPATGNRSTWSASANGSGAALEQPVAVRLDAAARRLLVTDYGMGRQAVVAIDLASGNRSTLAGGATGSGAALVEPFSLAADAAHGRVFVAGGRGARVTQIDLATLARTALASSDVGAGIRPVGMGGLVLESPGGAPASLLLTEPYQRLVMRIDLATGNRTVVAGPDVGSGIPLKSPTDLVLDTRPGMAGRALVLDGGVGHVLVSLDLQTGARTVLAELNSAVPDTLVPNHLVLDAARQRVVFTDNAKGVFAIDLAGGTRTTLSDGSHGSGSSLDYPGALLLDTVSDPAAPRLLVAGAQPGLTALGASGERSPFATSPPVGEGIALLLPGDLALDAARGRVLATDVQQKYLMAVDLASGQGRRVSGGKPGDASRVGGGPSLEYPGSMDVDLPRQVAYVASSDRLAVIAIDLVTGDRVIVSH